MGVSRPGSLTEAHFGGARARPGRMGLGPALGLWGPALGPWGPALGPWGPVLGPWGAALGPWGPTRESLGTGPGTPSCKSVRPVQDG